MSMAFVVQTFTGEKTKGMQPRREAGVAFPLSFELVALNPPDRMGLHSLCLVEDWEKTFHCQG